MPPYRSVCPTFCIIQHQKCIIIISLVLAQTLQNGIENERAHKAVIWKKREHSKATISIGLSGMFGSLSLQSSYASEGTLFPTHFPLPPQDGYRTKTSLLSLSSVLSPSSLSILSRLSYALILGFLSGPVRRQDREIVHTIANKLLGIFDRKVHHN